MSHNIAGAGDFVRALEEVLPELSKGQKRIAGYILENYDKAAYMTAQTLGETVGVSESTVVRFATELGFDGYPQLQIQLRETVRVRLTTVQRIEATNDRISDANVLDTILLNDADKIRATLDTVDRDAFVRAVDLILSAKNIYIMGMRSSAILADFMHYYFGLLFDNVRLIRPASGSEMFEHLMKVHSDDVIIAISFPTVFLLPAQRSLLAASGAIVFAISDMGVFHGIVVRTTRRFSFCFLGIYYLAQLMLGMSAFAA